jgi:dihydroxy-acid dehydratase
VCPEAWDGGPLAYVRDGDRIEINLPENRLALLISDDELKQRQKKTPVRPDHPATGMLSAYRQNVCGADQGAIWI